MLAQFNDFMNLNSPGIKEETKNNGDEGEEMIGCETHSFGCRKWENERPGQDFCIKINNFEFTVVESSGDVLVKVAVDKLTNITILKKNPLVLSFKFKDWDTNSMFVMRSQDDAKKCVSQVTKFYQMSLAP